MTAARRHGHGRNARETASVYIAQRCRPFACLDGGQRVTHRPPDHTLGLTLNATKARLRCRGQSAHSIFTHLVRLLQPPAYGAGPVAAAAPSSHAARRAATAVAPCLQSTRSVGPAAL